jgi:outer membrane protein OmpA-like peptidoglycan-associated protein
MRLCPSKRQFRIAGAALLLAFHGLDIAEEVAAPSTQEMVEALKPQTRSLRNLVVSEVANTSTAASRVPEKEAINATEHLVIGQSSSHPSLSMAIQFDFNSARLRPEGMATLDRLAAAMQSVELKDGHFLIEGHTDARGSADYNRRLSQQRADEVRRYLLAQGLSAQRLSAVGRGAQEPADPAAPQAAENRRVRIVNIE